MARHSIPDIIERAEPRQARVSVPARPLAMSLVLSLRPAQWTKNLIIFGRAAARPAAARRRVRRHAARQRRRRRVDRRLRRSSARSRAWSTCSTTSPTAKPTRAPDQASSADRLGRRAGAGRADDGRHPREWRALGAAFWLRPAFGLLGGRLCRVARALFGPAEARRHHRRADDRDRVRAARGRRRRGHRRGDQPLAPASSRSCWRCSWRSASAATSSCCSPTTRRATGGSCRSTARICWTR